MAKQRTASPPSPIAWLLLSFRGRISRRVYWPAYLALLCLNFALYFQLIGMTEEDFESWHPLLVVAGGMATLYANIAVAVKRLHDVGYGGFLASAVAVPILNLMFAVWIGILPGDPDANAYGQATDRPAR